MLFQEVAILAGESAGVPRLTFELFEKLWGESHSEPLYPGHEGPKTSNDDAVCSSKAIAVRKVRTIARRFERMPDPIPVWRALLVDDGSMIRLDQGESWGFSKSHVITFGMAQRKANTLIAGRAPKSAVDWLETWKRFIQYSYGGMSGEEENENEIVIPSSQVLEKTYQWVEPDEQGIAWIGSEPKRLVPGVRKPADDSIDFNMTVDEARHLQAESKQSTQSPAFQNWFAGSKVIDKAGKPLVVFHGTTKGTDFSSFRTPAFFTSSKKFAGHYADDPDDPGKVMGFFLSIKKPYIQDFQDNDDVGDVEEQANDPAWIRARKREGYDGCIFPDSACPDCTTYVAFYPQQIKSATDNAGTFDPDSSNFNEASAGLVARPLASFPKSFQSWFKGSKVVDEDGNPMPVYHGTASDFRKFQYSQDIGFHFGTIEQAEKIADYKGSRFGRGGGAVMPVYLSIKNPVVSHDAYAWYLIKPTLHAMERAGAFTEAEARRILAMKGSEEKKLHAARDLLKRKGYDGVQYENETGEGFGTSYIVFDSSQVKSAIGNRGTFSAKSPDITEDAHEDNDPVAYHGTRTEIRAGKFGGIHLGTKKAAMDRLDKTPSRRPGGRPGAEKVIKARVRLKNPYGSPQKPVSEHDLFLILNLPGELDKIKAQGHDGIIYRNEVEDPGSISYLVFDQSGIEVLEAVKQGATKPVLVLMHIDSLDPYGLEYSGPGFGRQFGRAAATQLGNAMAKKANEYIAKGLPVVIVDQHNDHHAHAENFLSQLPSSPLVTRIRFDESTQDWKVFDRKIVAVLKKLGAGDVELGGIWYDPGNNSGCAYRAEQIMRRSGFKVRPNHDILGGYDDYHSFDDDDKETDESSLLESKPHYASGRTPDGEWEMRPNRERISIISDIPDSIIKLRDHDGKVLAYMYGQQIDDSFYVMYSHVRDDMRGKGVYTRLLQSLQKQFTVYSDEPHNNSAKSIYTKLGAEEGGRHNDYRMILRKSTPSRD